MNISTDIEITVEEVLDRFKIAVNTFILNDFYLISHDVNERSLTHKIGEYLQPLFRKWDVDCEYNRDGHEPKRVKLPHLEYSVSVYPDVIIHKRGTNQNNLLILEAKKSINNSAENENFDRIKIEKYADSLGYTVGIFILFRTESDAGPPYRFDVFCDGKWSGNQV